MNSLVSSIARPLRIEPAFRDRSQILELFRICSPYPPLGRYLPDGVDTGIDSGIASSRSVSVLPWFRGNWALGGNALVAGAESILNNAAFLAAARSAFGVRIVRPQTVVVNLTAPMPAGEPHVDIPSFRGATREHYPLSFLVAMGASGLFERWRVVEAGAISWFYDGPGGAFDYWPDGLAGAKLSERPPFANIAILADNDRMYHRIGEVGKPGAPRPRLGLKAQLRAGARDDWVVEDDGQAVASYSAKQVRLSILWKAEVFADERTENSARSDRLSFDRVIEIFTRDLRARRIEFEVPPDPLKSVGFQHTLRGAYCLSSMQGANRS